jgi:6-phosphogluconolactonase
MAGNEMNRQIVTSSDRAELNRLAVEEIAGAISEATSARGRCRIALAGGSTPESVYAMLAEDERAGRRRLDWPKVEVFFGDERMVEAGHPDSNYRMAKESLLARVPIPAGNIYRIETELGPDESAARYEARLREVFGLSGPLERGGGERAVFDLVLLGLGADGHTASLFPGTAAVEETTRLVCANWVPELEAYRITLTYPVFNAARRVVFLVAGEAKAEAVRRVLEPRAGEAPLPAARVKPASGTVLWILDELASGLLRQ